MLIAFQGLSVALMAAAALVAMMGCFGLLNLFVSVAGGTWKGHLAVWLGSVLVFGALVLLMPRCISESPDGDRLIFSSETCGTRAPESFRPTPS